MPILRLIISIVVLGLISWFLWFINTPEVRYKAYPAHYKLVNGFDGPGDIISSGSSRSQTSMSSDILSERFECGLNEEFPIAHDISRSMPGMGIQFVMLRDAMKSREEDGMEAYKYALVEYKETHTAYKYHPFMYQVGTFGDLYESYVSANLDVNFLTRQQLFIEKILKKSVNTLGLIMAPTPAALTKPESKVVTDSMLLPNVDLTSSQLINSIGLKRYDNAQGKSWKTLPDRYWKIDADYERRALYYARKIKKLGDKYNTKIIFHSIPVYYQPAQSEFVKAQFQVGVGEPLYTPDKAWLDTFYQSGPFGDGGHMNRQGSSDYISWLAKQVFPECSGAIDIAETAFINTGQTAGQRFIEAYKYDKAIPESVPIPDELGFEDLTDAQKAGSPIASVRTLPYPFNRYLTLASDVDSQRWKTGRLIHEYLHDQLGLMLSDSIFISQGAALNDIDPDKKVMTVKYADTNQLVDLMEWFGRGWFDTIHGWGNHNFFSTKANLNLNFEDGSAKERYELEGRSLITSAQINQATDKTINPHVLSLVYRSSKNTKFVVSILDLEQKILWSSPSIEADTKRSKPVWFELSEELTIKMFAQAETGDIFVQIDAHSKSEDPFIEISNISVSSRNPITISNDIALLEKYNLNFPVFTTHGGAYAGLFGIENLAAMGMQGERAKLMLNVQGDNRNSDFYWMDLIDDYNLRYILPANRTSLHDDVQNIKGQTIHFKFRDGIDRYSFQRSIGSNTGEAANIGNMSYPNAIGHNIDRIVFNANNQQAGYGAVFYTHWGLLQNRPDPNSITEHFNRTTLDAFEKLQKLYYFGDENKNRYWVAPLVDALQYSRVHQAMKKRSTYDAARHRIDIYSVTDPVIGGPFPSKINPLADLANASFNVDDAANTRVFLDGMEITSLQRNPEDERGRQSVTIVNNRVYKPILRKVDFAEQKGQLALIGCNNKVGISQGLTVLKLSKLSASACVVSWKPAELDNRDATHLTLQVKSNDIPALELNYKLKSGESFDFTPAFGPQDSNGWRTVVINLHQIGHAAFARGERPTFGELGKGDIDSFSILFNGVSNLDIRDLGFIRQNGLPEYTKNYVIAGRVSGNAEMIKGAVIEALDSNGNTVLSATVEGNSFIFSEKVEKNRRLTFRLKLPSGKMYPPLGNAVHVIEKNTTGINFIVQ